ncbi:MAG: VIT1/CCC1 transporter family protein [Syntrophales bacterium]|nr:VIT1/CCC1 transporter family protein [Syntrophales bacterium]
MVDITRELLRKLLYFQKSEITEHRIYEKLAEVIKHPENSLILAKIAQDELKHYQIWKKYTGQEVAPSSWKVFIYYWISRIFGITFGIKLMERGEKQAEINYGKLGGLIPEIESIIHEESLHEMALIQMLDEERLRYTGSIVLGLNDALVELLGALAGLTLALKDTRLIALTGSITGIAAALSMSVSEYLSTKAEKALRSPLKASIYTGITYTITVILLITPYLIVENYFLCLVLTIIESLLIIALFNYYISVVREESFIRRFFEMAGLSLGVALVSFFIGFFVRTFLGIEV